ncbi:TAXI family TRAP transporter solute-binding subunit [Anianabacter salinae]|uniref:TAXI family TRAP transporter solute-binding subunit n=1 Tax=Anianabacter salinae TaxID=2851023 RepID=UPI00225DDCEA|nr:TAXI family TRAP transporter solute-binding subunit [Anianabacter salinae]MBV0911141.1 C4-dicarboxylate ABC transporter substrate-binding protein [Anianabacter salinae]
MKKTIALAALVAAAPLAVSAQVTLTAETSGTASPPQYVDATLAAVLNEAGVANVQITEGATLTNSLQAVAENRLDMSPVPLIIHFLLGRGIGPYAGVGPEKGAELASGVQALFFYASSHHLLGHYNSGSVQGWDSLEGKRIWNGPPRGAALTDGRTFIELVTGLKEGEGYEGVQSEWNEVVGDVTGGAVDAFVAPEGLPSGRITQMVAAGGMTLYDIPSDILASDMGKAVMSAPGHSPFSMPVEEYRAFYDGMDITVVTDDDTFDTWNTAFAESVSASMDEDLAYQITKAFLSSEDRMNSGAPFAPNLNLSFGDLDGVSQGACGAVTIKMHPGAIRAFEEAGRTVADCLKP